ncbi:MAG TPA: glycosyltransferase family 9 protein [Rhodocyclaceae bacterium]|nr:glycosyltransferase family 9 protein [Rhodocyclaceae bacterium]
MSRLPSRLLLQPMLAYGVVRGWVIRRRQVAIPRRILIAHHLLLGDTLMLTALLAKLRRQYPLAEIVMTCPPAIAGLFAARPHGVTALSYDPADATSLWALWRECRSRNGFDLALLPADNRLSWLARALGSRHIVGFAGDRPAYKNWFVDEFRHYPDSPMALPEIFASLVDGPPPPAFKPQDWPLVSAQAFDVPKAPYAVLHLGASSPLKLWPAERWWALAQWLVAQGVTPIWSAGKKEIALIDAVDPQARYVSYAGKLDLLQLAHLLRGASLLVCPDTGVAHLARAMFVPQVVLHGPGSDVLVGKDEFWRDNPYRGLSVDIECRDQDVLFKRRIAWVRRCARPLGNDMPNKCPRARCMEGISVERVMAACLEILHKPSSE